MPPTQLKLDPAPRLEHGRLIVGFSGWMDGGEVSTGTIATLASELDAGRIGEIDPDDFYIYNGYYTYPEEEFPKYRELGVRSAWILGGREVHDIFPEPGEIHVDARWRFGDASLYIPGHDIKILPVSGVVMTATLWMVVAEVAKHRQ